MAQSLSGFALLSIHMEQLFEWAVEILTEPSPDKPIARVEKNSTLPSQWKAQPLKTEDPKSGECR